MTNRNKLLVAGIVAAAAIGVGAAVSLAAGGDDDRPLTGTDYDRATAAALDHLGEGEVIETEVGDDGAAYEVEVQLDDGSVREVQLDADFNVIESESDDDSGEDEDDDAGESEDD